MLSSTPYFLKIEQDYNHALMDKYRTFLHFYHVNNEYQDDFEDLMALRHRSYNRTASSGVSLTRTLFRFLPWPRRL